MSTPPEVADEHHGDETADLHGGGDQTRPQTPDLKPLLDRRDHTVHVACSHQCKEKFVMGRSHVCRNNDIWEQ